jgi:hypothetical protein
MGRVELVAGELVKCLVGSLKEVRLVARWAKNTRYGTPGHDWKSYKGNVRGRRLIALVVRSGAKLTPKLLCVATHSLWCDRVAPQM